MNSPTKYRIPRKILRLANAIVWSRNRQMQSIGLTSSQGEAIVFVLRNHKDQTVTAGDLMDHLKLSQSTVAGIIQRLENKSLIYRIKDPEDSRKSIILPTEKGLELDGQLRASAVKMENLLLDGMSEEEQEEFSRLLTLAIENMEKYKEKGNG